MKRKQLLSFLLPSIFLGIIYFTAFTYIYAYETETVAVAGIFRELLTEGPEAAVDGQDMAPSAALNDISSGGQADEQSEVSAEASSELLSEEYSDISEADSSGQADGMVNISELTAPEPAPPTEDAPSDGGYDITLMALGDNLLHSGIIKTGMQDDGSLDYSFLFENISDFLNQADIKAINQETIFAGNDIEFTGFPSFNSPTQVGDAIVAAGFNVVLHATNHAADKGIKGINHCASFWERYPDILVTGIAGEEPASGIPLLEIGDVTFAILNYTYGPNSEVIGPSLRKHLNMLCYYNEKTGAIDFTRLNPHVTEDIREAETIADVVVVFPHWGTEYKTVPSKYQISFAKEMTEAGADLIIGTHPHVPQPVEWITADNGNRALCYYSLGNYVSLQKKAACMLEGMAWVTFHVSGDGVAVSGKKTGVLPMVCQYNDAFRLENVYLLEDYTEEMAQRHGIKQYEDGVELHLADLQELSEGIFGDMVLTRTEIPAVCQERNRK